jgi:CheY-like chemotaxis protein
MLGQPRSGKRLLVAEDVPLCMFVITRFLESLGYTFDPVKNGLDCLKLLNKNNYDLVLTDISMPVMDGVHLAKEIRAMTNEKRSIPIIAMTANAELLASKRFKAAGIDVLLAKPFSKEDLRRCIEKWL